MLWKQSDYFKLWKLKKCLSKVKYLTECWFNYRRISKLSFSSSKDYYDIYSVLLSSGEEIFSKLLSKTNAFFFKFMEVKFIIVNEIKPRFLRLNLYDFVLKI